MNNYHKALLTLVAASAAVLLCGCGASKPEMPVTPMPDAGTPGAGPQSPTAVPAAAGSPTPAPSLKPR